MRTASGELRAFSAICTHLNCTVQYRDDLGHIWCACHNGHYDLNGRNIAGPPPRPLEALVVNVRGDQIVVRKALDMRAGDRRATRLAVCAVARRAGRPGRSGADRAEEADPDPPAQRSGTTWAG